MRALHQFDLVDGVGRVACRGGGRDACGHRLECIALELGGARRRGEPFGDGGGLSCVGVRQGDREGRRVEPSDGVGGAHRQADDVA